MMKYHMVQVTEHTYKQLLHIKHGLEETHTKHFSFSKTIDALIEVYGCQQR